MIVTAVHRLTGRPWIFASGSLEGAPLRIGDTIIALGPRSGPTSARIETIELHNAPGRVTIAVSDEFVDVIRPGVVIVKPVD
jgi:hypothetical protein